MSLYIIVGVLLLLGTIAEVVSRKANDTLYIISEKFNTTIDKIKKDNNLNTNMIYPGATLIIS